MPKKRPNPLKQDPTRQAALRRRFLGEIQRRYKLLRAALKKLILEDDAFGLRPPPSPFKMTGNKTWPIMAIGVNRDTGMKTTVLLAGVTDPETGQLSINESFGSETADGKVKRFRGWLRTQMDSTLAGDALIEQYISSGYQAGVGRGLTEADRYRAVTGEGLTKGQKETLQLKLSLGPGKQAADKALQAQRVSGVMYRPATVEGVKLLAARAFTEMEDVNNRMATRMSRMLVDGLVRGISPRELAEDMAGELDLTMGRALTIARTELTRAHAEGQLAALGSEGVDSVTAMVEWVTAGDEAVCELCEPLEGIVFTLEEASGMLPRHPNCRCAWLPAKGGTSDK